MATAPMTRVDDVIFLIVGWVFNPTLTAEYNSNMALRPTEHTATYRGTWGT